MAINKKLISFATQAQFDLKLNAGDIDNRSIVFIEDKKRIWTHGVYFDTSWNYITGTPDTLDGYGITDAAKKINSLYYVEGNTTGTAGAWTGSVSEVTSLYAGLTIAYKIGVAGASTTNLNINGLGNKRVRRNTANLTTHLPVGTVVLLTYDGTRWVWADYHTNTTYAAMSVAEGIAGTVSTLRTMRADYLKQIVEHYIANTVPSAHTHPNFTRSVAGLVPAPGAATTTRYLREDGTWVVPPNTNTTYTTGTLAQLNAGTDTTGRLQTAKLLNDWINPKLDLKAPLANPTFTGNVSAPIFTGALSGNASSATKLQTARNINGVSFDGSANITIKASTTATLTRGSYLTGSNFDGSTATTWAVDATSTNTASKVVVRDASGNFSAGTITASLSGNASSATYASAVTLTADNATNATRYPLFVSAATGNLSPRTDTGFTYNPSTGALTTSTFIGNLTGIASSATKLQTARTIAGVSFNGTANIDIPFANLTSKPNTIAGYGITDAYTKTEISSLAIYVGGYNFSNGFLVKTDVARTENSMLVLHIKGNSYGGAVPINTFVQVYNYVTSDAIVQTGALNNGYRINEVKAFYYNNLVYFWVPQQTNFMTMTFQLLKAEGQVNRVDSVTNAAVPASGIEKMVTITPRTAWFEDTLTNLSQLTDNIGVATHIANKANPHAVTKAQVGLGSVNNTADSAKNVLSATKLTTARTINGTSFDGSAAITTANWGTARNIGVVNSDGTGTAVTTSVNGSANVNLKLPATIKASLAGNALSATKLASITTTFTGTYPVAFNVNGDIYSHTGITFTGSTNTLTAATFAGSLTGNASSATKVNNKLTLKFDTGTSENTNLYTYDGSAAKTIDIKAGSNVTLTKTANTVTISSTNTNTTYTTGTLAQLNTGTDATGRLQTAKLLNDWLNPKLNGKFDKTGGRLTTGTGDVNIELWRGTNASWNILNSGGYLSFQSNYTTVVGAYFDALKLDYNTGNALFKGNVTAPTFVGALSGNASTATTATNLSRSVVAGNGLTGGGALSANRTLTLGTPSTLTAASTNKVEAESHTHAITTTSVGAASTIVQTNGNGAIGTSRFGTYGVYSAAQTQGIWGMGSDYMVNATTTGLGTLYGLAYSYISVGGSSVANQHQIHFVNNGTAQVSVNLSSASVKATTFIGALSGNASTASAATKLQTARNIAGVSFDGTANIAIPFANLSNRPGTLAGYGIGASDSLLTAKNASLITSTSTTGVTNVVTGNTNTYLNIVQGGSVSSSSKITGTGSVTLSSNTSGGITIHGSEIITYPAGTKALLLSGTNTTNSVWSGKTLKDWYLEEIDILLDSDKFTGSTFSSNVIDLTNVNGSFNVNSVNNYTTYTLSNKKVRGAWARVLVNSSIPITVTGVELINLGSNFERHTDMYLNIMYDGINTIGYYTKVIGKATSSYYINTSSTLVAFTNTPIDNFSNTESKISIDGVNVPKNTIKEIYFTNEYSSTTTLSGYFLYDCNSLTSINLSGLASVTRINGAFLRNCSSLTSVDLSLMTRLTRIDSDFLYLSGVKTLKMGAVVPPTLGGSIYGNLTSILVPPASVNAYKGASYWSAKASIITGY